MKPKYVTQWFSPKKKPVRIGVYQRDSLMNNIMFSYWNGKYWGVCSETIERAKFLNGAKSLLKMKWRGIAK